MSPDIFKRSIQMDTNRKQLSSWKRTPKILVTSDKVNFVKGASPYPTSAIFFHIWFHTVKLVLPFLVKESFISGKPVFQAFIFLWRKISLLTQKLVGLSHRFLSMEHCVLC